MGVALCSIIQKSRIWVAYSSSSFVKNRAKQPCLFRNRIALRTKTFNQESHVQEHYLISPFTIPAEESVRGFSARSFIDNKNNFFRLKRLLDIVISAGVILFVLSWLIPVMAVLICLDSRGPAFFRQKRVGRGGKSFHC
jgi:hypothetical protein